MNLKREAAKLMFQVVMQHYHNCFWMSIAVPAVLDLIPNAAG